MPAQVRARAAPPRTLRVATPTTAPRSSKGIPAGRGRRLQRVLSVLPAEARSLATHTRNPYLLVLEVELLRNGEADLMSNITAQSRGRSRRLAW